MTAYESNLHKSWHDSAWIPHLNNSNVLAYFSERTNPFYNRQCNNEYIKMQRLSNEKLADMIGVEYILLHFQEPILYVIREQHRHSPTHATPIADYYIIAGIVYQAPDLNSIINSRMLNAVHSLGSAFEEAQSFSRYHPSKGYWWEFKDNSNQDKKTKEKMPVKDTAGSYFQRERVNILLIDFENKFSARKLILPEKADDSLIKIENKEEIKQEKTPISNSQFNSSSKPPPEKKQKLMR